MKDICWQDVQWRNTAFLAGNLLVAVVAGPLYAWRHGLDRFHLLLFLFFFAITGLSITVGYHRLFSHLSFQARWPVRLFTLLFGAAAFENSALCWAADHRRHHKHVDHDEDPYNISKGFFHAHMGWILFKQQPETTFEGVKDLRLDPLVQWQHRHYLVISASMGFVLPALAGWVYDGWSGALGGFLIAGVCRVALVQQLTFFINSFCHTLGRQPYSSRHTARDSALMAFLTFGEGYHNFHHEFQHDYRNGVKPWQFDPTKWSIWLLHHVGLAGQLRRVPEEKILRAEIMEQKLHLVAGLERIPEAEPVRRLLETTSERLQEALENWRLRKAAYRLAVGQKIEASRERVREMRREIRQAKKRLRAELRGWRDAYRIMRLVSSNNSGCQSAGFAPLGLRANRGAPPRP